MTTLWQDGFAHYGTGADGLTEMLAGTWAQASSLGDVGVVPEWWDNTGTVYAINQSASDSGHQFRRVLPGGGVDVNFVSCHFATDELPGSNNDNSIVSFRDNANAEICRLCVESTGTLALYKSTSTQLAVSGNPCIFAQTAHHLEMKWNIDGHFEVRVDGTAAISVSGLTFANANQVAQHVFISRSSHLGGENETFYITDLILCDDSGTRNNDFEGERTIATLFPNDDGVAQGWTARPRHKFGNGILDNRAATNACVTAASAVSTDLGSGDYTVEMFARFFALPDTTNIATLFGKWSESDNKRSYQLYLEGPDLGSELVFRISTDGGAGTVTELIAWPWVPDTDRWYHIAVSRSAAEIFLFIDGVQQGVAIADSNTYFAGSAATAIGAQVSSTSTAVANTGMNGFFDEVRLTVGFARYDTDFTPPSNAFGRNSGADPEFSNVALLCGFDSSIADESSFGRTLTARNGSVRNAPNDGDAVYQTIDDRAPEDDTFVEAAFIPAEDTYTLGANPSDGQTITVGTYTSSGSHTAVYRFKTALAAAFDVLIGATLADSRHNLIQAINLDTGSGTLYHAGTIINDDVYATALPSPQFKVTAFLPGTGGNSIAATGTAGSGAWDTATLTGGEDIPSYSEFEIQRPPPKTTVVKSVTIVTRSFKNEAGTCNIQASLVGALGGVLTGADNMVTTNPAYREDIFETDPDTSGDLSPTAIASVRVRLDRTA